MLLRYLVLLISLWPAQEPQAQTDAANTLAIEGLSVIDAYDDELGYYVFYTKESAVRARIPVVFVHGYGALNPMVYGAWIRYLAESGHVVIFPRYQKGLFVTSSEDFVPNTATAIAEALKSCETHKLPVKTDQMYLLGHSYGGVICANLAVTWLDRGLPRPAIALLAEPGSGPLKGGVLDGYNGMGTDLQLLVIVGEDDLTVGQSFGSHVYETAVNTPARALLWQFPSSGAGAEVSASHYEPYAIDLAFDNGIVNFSTKRALRLARTDQVDHHGYWKAFDVLSGRARSASNGPYALHELDLLADLGYWADKTPVRKMEYRNPDNSATR